MAAPKNWDATHDRYKRENGELSKGYPAVYFWEHSEMPDKIYISVVDTAVSTIGEAERGRYRVDINYNGVHENRAMGYFDSKEEARKHAVNLARMYSNPEKLRNNITRGINMPGDRAV